MGRDALPAMLVFLAARKDKAAAFRTVALSSPRKATPGGAADRTWRLKSLLAWLQKLPEALNGASAVSGSVSMPV